MKKRSKYRPKVKLANPIAYVMESLTPVTRHDSHYLLDLKLKNSAAMVALLQGTANKEDVTTLVAMSNIVEALHHLGFGKEYGDVSVNGRAALVNLGLRAKERGKFTPTGPEIKALQDLMELHDAQMEIVTVRDIEKAVEFAKSRSQRRKALQLPKVAEELKQ